MRKIFDKIQENGQDIDTTIFCECGNQFDVYVPGAPYKCEGCGRLYEGKVVIELLEESDLEDNFTLVGKLK